jgi:hypothetical protein
MTLQAQRSELGWPKSTKTKGFATGNSPSAAFGTNTAARPSLQAQRSELGWPSKERNAQQNIPVDGPPAPENPKTTSTRPDLQAQKSELGWPGQKTMANGDGNAAHKQMHLTAFMRPVSLHTGAWRYPGAYPDANFNLNHLKSFIQKLEEAKFGTYSPEEPKYFSLEK